MKTKAFLTAFSTATHGLCSISYKAIVGSAVAYAISTSAIASTQLHLLSWESYIDPEVVAEFEDEFDAELVLQIFDSDDQRDIHLAERDGRGYDVIVIDGTQLQRYAQLGWLAPVDELGMDNRQYIDERWATAFPAAERYGTPYFWGMLGIAWRNDLWPEGFHSWQQLLDPDPALKGRLMMTSHARELVSVALKSEGISANIDDPASIDAAGRILIAQGPSVGFYGYPDLNETAPLLTGDAVAGMLYNGDALVLQEINPDIHFRVPDEGGMLWIDYLGLSAYASQPQLAADFINFLNRPQIAARQAEYVQYASPNAAANTLLPAEFLDNKDIYPSTAVMAASEFSYLVSARTQRRINAIGAYLMAR